MRRPALAVALAVTLVALTATLIALVAPALAAAAPARTSLPAVESQVMCVTCKIPLTVAQSPQADRERAFIQELIDQGQDETQVKQSLVAQYGPQVLALPATHGFDLAAYLVPIVVVALVLALLVLLLPRWRRHARAQPAIAAGIAGQSDTHAGAAQDGVIGPADAARLEADMARYD